MMMLRAVGRRLRAPVQVRALSGRGGDDEEEREFQVLKKVHSINSGVDLSRGEEAEVSEDVEDTKKRKIRSSLMIGDVHGSYRTIEQVSSWRKRPLFRRAGKNLTFTSGQEAAELLVDEVRRRDPYQIDFLQCVQEASSDVAVAFEDAPKLAWVFKQIMEPERLITFRVPWTDDNGNARINRGYRIQYSSALGPYHGGLRFHPHLSHGSIRMLGWEQTMKNALTGYDLGGSRGGSDFDPLHKSEAEIKRFCKSFMHELCEFVGPQVDTLETDLGVGRAEMSYMHRSFIEIESAFAEEGEDALGVEGLFGAAEIFPEASGFGSVYFAERALEAANATLKGKRCLLSGSGTLARSTALKLLEKGAVPLTFSDETGFLVDERGLNAADVDAIHNIKMAQGSLKDYAAGLGKTFHERGTLWEHVKGDLAFPCSIQGELNADDATMLSDSGCIAVFENADRACTATAQAVFEERHMLYAPSKSVNVGSVIASAALASGEASDVAGLNTTLEAAMPALHDRIYETAERHGCAGNLRAGANLAAFIRIANSPMYVGSSK